MTFIELEERVASEAPITVQARVFTPDLAALARRPGGLAVRQLLDDRAAASRDVTYRHVLGAPCPEEELRVAEQRLVGASLPADLRALLRRWNGIHLWANAETGRTYFGLAPLAEWAPVSDLVTDDGASLLRISYHQDGAAMIALDTRASVYYLVDAAGPELDTPIARSADELLDWLWQNRRRLGR